MSEHTCPICLRMKFSNHVCAPIFCCRFADVKNYGDEWEDIRETCAESAAEKFAEEYDWVNEHNILRQGDSCEEIIEVRDPDDRLTRWRIHGESVPHYYAEEADEEEDDAPQPAAAVEPSGGRGE